MRLACLFSRLRPFAVSLPLGLAACAGASGYGEQQHAGSAAQDVAMAGARRVELSKAEPGAGCAYKGTAEGKHNAIFAFPDYGVAMNDLERRSAAIGGNYAVIDSIGQMGGNLLMVRARVYHCSPVDPGLTPAAASGAAVPSVASPSAGSAVVAGACEPDCSPGYVCLRGQCVSACNPACAAGLRCEGDRMCHPIK